ncbi:MAG: 3-hydroxyisobutyrate dehydrogenase [Tatlockia sp.]|jgi:3-hydroxyisobutyrate dehydrogenase
MANIGFVGLGHMGFAMALNLIKANHQVTGFDLNKDALAAFSKAGGISAQSLSSIAASDFFITVLQTGQQVSEVYLGEEGLFAKASKTSLFIDCSSIDVETTKMLHEQAKKRGLCTIDAPVSGGMAGARDATLTFLAGGEEKEVQRAIPILNAMGKKIIPTGASGSGQAAKICNNLILGISMIAVSEAFVLARHLGLSSHRLFEVVNNASGQCWTMSHYCPAPDILPGVPASHHYEPGFAAAMMLKDLKTSQQAAKEAGITTPLGAAATELYQQFNAQGFGQLDFSAIIKAIEKQAIAL